MYRLTAIVFACSALFYGTAAQAFGPQWRTYLSSKGLDTNPCSVIQPCRLLPAAIAQTQDGGEVVILDAANYSVGTVTIDQSITISGPSGALASLTAVNSNAVDVTAANASVTFRNLLIRNLAGSSNAGIYTSGSGTTLSVEDCEIVGLAFGVYSSADHSTRTTILQSRFRENGNALTVGTSDGTGRLFVDRSIFSGKAGNGAGIAVSNASGTVTNSSVIGMRDGINVTGGGRLTIDNDIVTQNEYGLEGATFISLGNNTVRGNTSDAAAATLASTSKL